MYATGLKTGLLPYAALGESHRSPITCEGYAFFGDRRVTDARRPFFLSALGADRRNRASHQQAQSEKIDRTGAIEDAFKSVEHDTHSKFRARLLGSRYWRFDRFEAPPHLDDA